MNRNYLGKNDYFHNRYVVFVPEAQRNQSLKAGLNGQFDKSPFPSKRQSHDF